MLCTGHEFGCKNKAGGTVLVDLMREERERSIGLLLAALADVQRRTHLTMISLSETDSGSICVVQYWKVL